MSDPNCDLQEELLRRNAADCTSAMDGFEESKHPRAPDGKFGAGTNSNTSEGNVKQSSAGSLPKKSDAHTLAKGIAKGFPSSTKVLMNHNGSAEIKIAPQQAFRAQAKSSE